MLKTCLSQQFFNEAETTYTVISLEIFPITAKTWKYVCYNSAESK
ncbi:hypothetical protein J500_1132 [Acinetobacter sp. 479375]|nr:hypothetical protein J500_1132 [Acinetobacter sp. 479375]BBF77780.1 hypothetical protein URS_1790 [Acinetobacter ursingii]